MSLGRDLTTVGTATLLIRVAAAQVGQRQNRFGCVAVEHVIDRGAPAQQPAALRIALVQQLCIGGGDNQLLQVFVVPAERGDVVVVTKQDTRLARRSL